MATEETVRARVETVMARSDCHGPVGLSWEKVELSWQMRGL
ncbi:hypothetical protein OXB_1420 [Bacillus sp. OxB-1]|nr:hypothetical protein [Bacillus sp. OxB-1]BAQ09891.1 hypothetical protein OXB_1420 [Bacillus sp. OxB-1]